MSDHPRFSFACSVVLLVAASSRAQAPLCEQEIFHPDSGHPTTLSVQITAPLPGTEIRRFAPDCPTEFVVEGIASTLGIPPRFDFYLVIDISGSTSTTSGADIDGDGDFESVLEAEIAASRSFINALDMSQSRVAVILFSSDASIRQPLTSDLALLHAALDALYPGGNTNFGAALTWALAEHELNHDPTRNQVILFLSDGAPTAFSPLPPGLFNCIGFDPDACSGILWAEEAGTRGIVVNTFAVGVLASSPVLAEMALRGNGQFFQLDVAGEIIDVLPAVVHVGVRDVVLFNDTLGESLVVLPGPDGRFAGSLPLADGLNEIRVVARALQVPAWETTCFTDVSKSCLEWLCPAPIDAECTEHATVTGFAAWASDAGVSIQHDSAHASLPGADASGTYPLGRTDVTWTFTDAIAGSRTCSSSATIHDTLPPSFSDIPPGGAFSCTAPPPVAPVAFDACDPAPLLSFDEILTPGDCPDRYEIRRRWTATDASGHSTQAEQHVIVTDDEPPLLLGLAPDEVASCEAPPAPIVTTLDQCDPNPSLEMSEVRMDGPCPGTYELVRTWTSQDRCGNAVSALQRVSVRDTTPPLISTGAGRVICLWPPRHDVHVVGAAELGLSFSDDCGGAVTWTFTDCAPDQPDDGLGDGSTAGDCTISADGHSLLVRAERQGRGAGKHVGRTYTASIIATDACGNATPATVIGTIAAPHDRSEHDRTCGR